MAGSTKLSLQKLEQRPPCALPSIRRKDPYERYVGKLRPQILDSDVADGFGVTLRYRNLA